MAFLRVTKIRKGIHPSERIVEITTKDGPEQLPVFTSELNGDSLVRVGYPIDARNGSFLVELPSETARGMWRVWVNSDDFVEEAFS